MSHKRQKGKRGIKMPDWYLDKLVAELMYTVLGPDPYEPYPGPNSWCPTHHCQFELIYRDPPGYEFYECPECERERGDALGLI